MSVLWLDEIAAEDGPRVGSKAHTLARLRRAGLPVPDGFVLVAGSALDGPGRDALLAAYLRLGGSVAVRSSSAAEDLGDASFAGQYRTLLDVRGPEAVLAAAAACLSSAEAGAAYARAVAAPERGAMAVLVQRFVEPRAAGVAFTRHPQEPDSLLLESHAGRGEELVSGRVTPDRYVFDRATGASRAAQTGGSLDPPTQAAVVALARRVEDVLGAAQDVEWAVGPEGVVLLQARPITVAGEAELDPRLQRLTRANVGEVLPDPVTPLTWTTLGAFLEHAFRTLTTSLGLLSGNRPPFLVLYRERLYMNLTLCAEVAARLPGIAAADAERLILGGGAAQAAAPQLSAGALPRLVRVGFGLLRLGAGLPRSVEQAAASLARLDAPPSPGAAQPAALALGLRAWAALGRELATTHVAASGASAFRLALLTRLLARMAPGDAPARVNRLVAGLDDVASAQPTTALERLAERVRRDPAAQAPGVAEFLEAYGHRALAEGELRAPTWRDDPRPVFDALRAFASSTRSPGFRRRARAEVRQADEEALLARLGRLRRPLMQRALEGAQRWVRERERTKAVAVALMDHGRRLARAAARTLVETGVLRREEDVFFLELPELIAALEGRGVPAARLERRRRRFAREGALPAPRDVDLAATGAAEAAPDAGLNGIGVSAGVGMGPARVLDGSGPPHLEPGEVLVAPVLDAALGPLLSQAAGAVVEIGGLLSHGSVVARELGVPCVVDVRDATRRIRAGERVLVDGGTGRVTVWPAEAEAATIAPESLHADADPADEAFHQLEAHPLARESVYFNVQDPETGLALVASVGVRSGGRGEALLALALPDGRLWFGLELARPRPDVEGLAVGGARIAWKPVAFCFDGRLAVHEAADFPPALLPLALAPRTEQVRLELEFQPASPAIDFCAALSEQDRDQLSPLGRHHIEQSGRWRGSLVLGGRHIAVDGTGSRDHSWGLRRWEAADHWRLFTVRFGDDLAVHALAVSVNGHVVEGGFVYRDGRAERITRIEYAGRRVSGRLAGLELEIATAAGPPLQLQGEVWRTITVPVQIQRSWRALGRRPYRLVLHENFTRYTALGRTGHGMAEFTERPR